MKPLGGGRLREWYLGEGRRLLESIDTLAKLYEERCLQRRSG